MKCRRFFFLINFFYLFLNIFETTNSVKNYAADNLFGDLWTAATAEEKADDDDEDGQQKCNKPNSSSSSSNEFVVKNSAKFAQPNSVKAECANSAKFVQEHSLKIATKKTIKIEPNSAKLAAENAGKKFAQNSGVKIKQEQSEGMVQEIKTEPQQSHKVFKVKIEFEEQQQKIDSRLTKSSSSIADDDEAPNKGKNVAVPPLQTSSEQKCDDKTKIAKKRKTIQEFDELMVNNSRDSSQCSRWEFENILANKVGFSATTIRRWKKELGMNTSNRRFTKEQKRKIVEDIRRKKIPSGVMCQRLGIQVSTLCRWKIEFGGFKRLKYYSPKERFDAVKKYKMLKKTNPALQYNDYANMLNIGTSTLSRWRTEFEQATNKQKKGSSSSPSTPTEEATAFDNNDIWVWNYTTKRRT